MLFMEWNKTYHRRKICIIFFSVVLMSMVLCGRLVYLMLFEGKYYETQAKDLQQRKRKIRKNYKDAFLRPFLLKKLEKNIDFLYSIGV